MLPPDEIKRIIEGLAAGTATSAEQKALSEVFDAQKVTLAVGEHAVALGNDVTDTVIITGNNNFVWKGADAAVIKQALAEFFETRPEFAGKFQESLQQIPGHQTVSLAC